MAKHFTYRPFHNTLPRSSAFVNWFSVRFYETDCIKKIYDLYFILFFGGGESRTATELILYNIQLLIYYFVCLYSKITAFLFQFIVYLRYQGCQEVFAPKLSNKNHHSVRGPCAVPYQNVGDCHLCYLHLCTLL